MLGFVIAALVSATGGALAYLFKDTVLAAVFKKFSPAQAAVNTEMSMAQDVANPPDKRKVVEDLNNGAF